MANLVPINFPIPPESAITSYPYSDIESGTGTVIYFGASEKSSSTTTYILTTKSVSSQNSAETVGSGGSGSKEYNLDLSPFNVPKVVKGKGFLNLTVEGSKNTNDGTINVAVRVLKYSGLTETELSSSINQDITVPGNTTTSKTILFPLALTETIFKIGDILRLEIIVTWSVTSGSFTIVRLGMDPVGRYTFTTSSNTSSVLALYIPFRLTL